MTQASMPNAGIHTGNWTPAEQRWGQTLSQAAERTGRDTLGEEVLPDSLQQLIEKAAAFAENMAQQGRHPLSPPVACADKCSWCCNQQVRATAPEIFRIVRHLDDPDLQQRRAATVARLQQLDKATRGLSAQGRARIPKPCAFLVDNRCSIYEVRPMACAEYTSYDVGVCKRWHRLGQRGTGGPVHEKARLLAFTSVQAGMVRALTNAAPQADSAWLELTAAVVDALKTPDAEASWLRGEPIFAAAHLATNGAGKT